MNAQKIAIGIVDDHQIVIDGLTALLKGHEKFEIAFAVTNPAEVMDLIKYRPIDVLLTDIMMPQLPGNLLARHIKEKYPLVKIMALSMSGEGDLIHEMIENADIAGYVLKNIGKQELIHAVEKIAGGGIYFSDEVIEELEKARNLKRQKTGSPLTSREIEIIRLIEKEYNNRQIAETLHISERTVETHRKNIFRKTNTNSVIGLIKYAYMHRLI